MAVTPSAMVELGTPAPDFRLPEPGTDRTWTLADFAEADVLVVAFICNHCPFVVHLRDALAEFARDYADKGADKGVAVVAINSNDVTTHPDDAPEKMVDFARAAGFTFPYLFDETQETARAYDARCTPDFFVYDEQRRLVYRGQFDETRPNQGTPDGSDLRAAVDAVLAGAKPPAEQIPSQGCNIKWKE